MADSDAGYRPTHPAPPGGRRALNGRRRNGYNLGDVEKLRERLAASRGYVWKLEKGRKVVPLHRDTPAEQRVARRARTCAAQPLHS